MNRAVVVDRWDLLDLEQALEVPEFKKRRGMLGKQLAPWGGDALDDVFFLLYKARPELTSVADVERTHVVGHVLVSLLAMNPTVQRLQASTMRDVVAAATAAAKLAPQLAAVAQESACPKEEEALAAALAEDDPEAADQRLQDLEKQVQAKAELALPDVETAVEQVADTAEHQAEAAGVWGLEAGELRRLPIAERLALAKELDTAHMRKIVDLFGRLRMALFAERTEMTVGIEPVDVELGGDLSRMVGSELLSLLNNELLFAKIGDGALAQYAMRGEEPLGKGGIVLCVDGSWSMTQAHQGYTRELWASALKILLLQTAVRENRPFHVIDFGGSGELRYHRLVDSTERTPARMLDMVSTWFGSGTDFVGPLRRTIHVLAEERDRDSDVVFVSDGECELSDRTRDTYRRGTRSRRTRTWGVQLGPTPGALTEFCDTIFKVSDLTSGRELGELLNAVESPRST